MARLGITRIAERRKRIVAALTVFLEMYTAVSALVLLMASTTSLNSYRPSIKHYSLDSYYKREYVQRILNNNELCISLLRMNLQTFSKLCEMLESLGGLKPTRNMTIGEQVVIFLHILAHHVKNRVIQYNYGRSGESISRAFHKVLNAIMHLQGHLFRTPEPISANCTDSRWKWFKNCLGALDGTFIKVNVPSSDKPRYRTRKGDIATNVLGVCTPDMQFVYVLSGWEGSVADSRVLRDAIRKRSDTCEPITADSLLGAAMMLSEKLESVGDKISKSLGTELTLQQKIEQLEGKLSEIEGLEYDDKFMALIKLPEYPNQMLVFFSLAADQRLEWVKMFLATY
ncbi:uncharacterized protein LOC116015858 [Ipomoea triloba]|uniref:uncharacterized protein LOC116015858 n=1 Tax=Ipomoea triloba TaxID=35885 RepID=UPI00125E52DF|nr:uncharacterized protein LOC116015858 [Ipomoea triloba]